MAASHPLHSYLANKSKAYVEPAAKKLVETNAIWGCNCEEGKWTGTLHGKPNNGGRS